jgi:hypothetical protein
MNSSSSSSSSSSSASSSSSSSSASSVDAAIGVTVCAHGMCDVADMIVLTTSSLLAPCWLVGLYGLLVFWHHT